MEENEVFTFLSSRLHLTPKSNYDRSLMIKWRDLAERYVIFKRKKKHNSMYIKLKNLKLNIVLITH